MLLLRTDSCQTYNARFVHKHVPSARSIAQIRQLFLPPISSLSTRSRNDIDNSRTSFLLYYLHRPADTLSYLIGVSDGSLRVYAE